MTSIHTVYNQLLIFIIIHRTNKHNMIRYNYILYYNYNQDTIILLRHCKTLQLSVNRRTRQC